MNDGENIVLPSKHSVVNSVCTVIYLHVVKLTNIMCFQTKVMKTQSDSLSVFHKYFPRTNLCDISKSFSL